MKRIKFARIVLPYQSGEVAMFEDADADRFIQAGAAVEVDENDKPINVEPVAEIPAILVDQPTEEFALPEPQTVYDPELQEEPVVSHTGLERVHKGRGKWDVVDADGNVIESLVDKDRAIELVGE